MEIITSLLIIVLICCIDQIIRYSKQKTLKERVASCVARNRMHGNLTLLEDINDVKADIEYKIVSEAEGKIANEILQCYKSELIQDYFNDRLNTDRKIIHPDYHLEDRAYFFITLSSFLRDHECETYFNSKAMYTLKSKKTYGYWGGELYDATYELTDVGIVYHKMFYLTQLFCETRGWSSHRETERIIECLETKEIKISRV